MDLLARLAETMDNRVYEYYQKMNYKCFDKYYLLDLMFPLNKGNESEHVTIQEKLIYAIKENNHILMAEVADFLLSLGLMDWGNHLIKISVGMKNQYLRKSNIKRLKK